MDVLDWARGPLLALALAVFVAGTSWRLLALWRLPASHRQSGLRRRDFSRADAVMAALRHMKPRAPYRGSATLATVNPYLFHVGLALVFFGYAPHIAFVRRLTGLSWPALPDPAVYLAAAVTIVSLLVSLLFRLTDPVLKRISTKDDLLAWAVTLLPVMTGMAVIGEPSAAILAQAGPVDRAGLALHLLSFELLLVWFPFGKLMHAFLVWPARMQLAAFFGRRGVRP
jgi:nitrate reductase gamma subunit